MPTSPSREAWLSGYSESERPADRRQRTSDDDTAEPLTPVSGDRQLKYKSNSGKVDVGGPSPNAKVDSCPKGRDKNPGSMLDRTKEQKQARRQRKQQKKRKARRRHNQEERKDQSTTPSHRPPSGRAKAFQDAGLPSKGLWTLSQRNKAKRISQMEEEPDQGKLVLFDLRKGLS